MIIQAPIKDGLYIRPIRPNRRWIRFFVKRYPVLVGGMLSLIVFFSMFFANIDFRIRIYFILGFLGIYWIYYTGRVHIRKHKIFGKHYSKPAYQFVRILGLIIFVTGYLFLLYSKTSYLDAVQTDTLWLLYLPIITAISQRESRKLVFATLVLVFFCLFFVHLASNMDEQLSTWQILLSFMPKVFWITFISGTSYILLRYTSDAVADLNLIINVQNRMREMEGTLLRSKVHLDETNYLERAAEIIKDDLFFDHVNIFRVDKYKQRLICVAGACDGGKKLAREKFSLSLDDGKSINGFVVKSGDAYISNSVEKDSHYLPHDVFPNTKSEMVVPIIVRNRLYGVLDIQVHQPDYFLEQDQVAIEILANHIGWVIDNSEQFDHISWINRVIESIAAPIFTQNHLDETLQEIADSAQKEMGVDLVFLYSYNPNAAEELSGPIYSGALIHPEIMDSCPSEPDNIVYRLLEHEEIMLVNENIKNGEFEDHPLFKPSFVERRAGRPPFITRENIKSNVIVRLMNNGSCVGILFLNFRRPRSFSDWDKKRYLLFAHMAALAIQKMQLQQNVIQSELNELSNWIHDILIGDTLGLFKILRSINVDADKIGCSQVRNKIDQALEAAEDLHADIRNINRFLKDNPYEDLMLELEKLKMLFEQIFKVNTELNWSGDFSLISPELSREIFLVIREASNNALRHGKAKNIIISGVIKRNYISAKIMDDGTGFNPSQVIRMNGLLSMRYRIEEMNGTYKLTSNPGKGTRISLKVPLQGMLEGAS